MRATALAFVALLSSVAAAQEPAPAAERARELISGGDLAGALAALEAAAGDEALADADRALLGVLYLEADRPADALAVLEPLTARQPADPAVLYNAARAALRLGRDEQAEAWLAASAAAEPVSPAARRLGLRRLEQGRWDDAWRLLVPWARAAPTDEEAWVAAIAAALEAGRPADALALLAEQAPERPQPALLRARILARRGDAAAAAAALAPVVSGEGGERLAVERPDLFAEAARERGRALAAAGRWAEAAADLERATDLDPGDREAWKLLGEVRIETGDEDTAYAALRRAQELAAEEDGEAPPAAELAARLRAAMDDLRAGRNAEALAVARSLAALAPDHPDVHYLLGVAAAAAGDTVTGERHLRRARALAPGHTPALTDLAALLLQGGRREEARRLLERVVELRPGDPEALRNLATLGRQDDPGG